jgi:hypothetical protein
MARIGGLIQEAAGRVVLAREDQHGAQQRRHGANQLAVFAHGHHDERDAQLPLEPHGGGECLDHVVVACTELDDLDRVGAALFGEPTDLQRLIGCQADERMARGEHLAPTPVRFLDQVHLALDRPRVGADLARRRRAVEHRSTPVVSTNVQWRPGVEGVELHVETHRADVDQLELGLHATLLVALDVDRHRSVEDVATVDGEYRPGRVRKDRFERGGVAARWVERLELEVEYGCALVFGELHRA